MRGHTYMYGHAFTTPLTNVIYEKFTNIISKFLIYNVVRVQCSKNSPIVNKEILINGNERAMWPYVYMRDRTYIEIYI